MAGKKKSAKPTIQGHWDRFERWRKRFEAASAAHLDRFDDESLEDESFDFSELLYVASWDEWLGLSSHAGAVEIASGAPNQVNEKVEFVRAYFRDISFDGPVFMEHFSKFLTCQYPSRCDSAYAFWFDQGEVSLETPWVLESALFLPSIDAVDYYSIMEILEFQAVRIRAPRGREWFDGEARNIAAHIKQDLAQDGLDVVIRARSIDGELMELTLKKPKGRARK